MEKKYIMSVDTLFLVSASNEDELYERANDILMQMLADRQVAFIIEEEIEE